MFRCLHRCMFVHSYFKFVNRCFVYVCQADFMFTWDETSLRKILSNHDGNRQCFNFLNVHWYFIFVQLLHICSMVFQAYNWILSFVLSWLSQAASLLHTRFQVYIMQLSYSVLFPATLWLLAPAKAYHYASAAMFLSILLCVSPDELFKVIEFPRNQKYIISSWKTS